MDRANPWQPVSFLMAGAVTHRACAWSIADTLSRVLSRDIPIYLLFYQHYQKKNYYTLNHTTIFYVYFVKEIVTV